MWLDNLKELKKAKGMSAKQIGERIGKDDRSVNNAIYRIRKKLRSQLQ